MRPKISGCKPQLVDGTPTISLNFEQPLETASGAQQLTPRQRYHVHIRCPYKLHHRPTPSHQRHLLLECHRRSVPGGDGFEQCPPGEASAGCCKGEREMGSSSQVADWAKQRYAPSL